MKVVLFCGGFGTRLRDYSEAIPKPMVPVGYRPILWHVMKYYAHYGHTDFILCLGYRADAIKQYFLNYDECLSNDFTLSQGGRQVDLANSDISDWQINFVDTGTRSNIGERLMAVRPYLDGEEAFLANYADNLTDLPLPELIDFFHTHSPIGLFAAVRPTQTFHVVKTGDDGHVHSIVDVGRSDMWINGGYFVLSAELFKYMEKGDELVIQPFQRLIAQGRLMAYKYEGFWACMDTFKDKQELDERYARGDANWEVWKRDR
jgi:glucose-1-phosphate cytidylyltransferase